jgi:Zn-dependent protease with chaperone function
MRLPATWFDGASPVAQPAELETDDGWVVIHPSEAAPVRWPIEEVQVLSEPDAPVLRLSVQTDARLDVSDAAAIAALGAHLRGSQRRTAARGRRHRRTTLVVGASVLLVVGVGLGWPHLADLLARATPLSAEAALGEAVDRKLFGEVRRCEAPAGSQALAALVAKLAPHAAAAMPLSVVVLDNPLVNAAAMPGGRIVIFRGLLREAASAEEVAGVIAHEMGHAAARHGMRGLYRGLGLSLLASLASGGSTIADAAVFFATMAHSRAFERDADARAEQILRAAGIGTQGLIDFFARMEKRDGDAASLLAYAASHPPSADRRAAITPTQAVQPLDYGQWQALRAICG